jgi:type IV pilus assembly protein PilA
MVVRNKMKNQRGFTLVELMTVVAIIGVLASVGVPQYRKIQRKAKRAEATLAMGVIASSEAAFFAEYNGYGDNLGGTGAELESAPQNYNVGFLGNNCITFKTAGFKFYEQNQADAGVDNPGTFPGYNAAAIIFPVISGSNMDTANKSPTNAFQAILRTSNGLSALSSSALAPSPAGSSFINGCSTGGCKYTAIACGNLYGRTGSDIKVDVMSIDHQRKISIVQDGT